VSDNLRLHGFNNLTSSLSFNIYDICYAKTEEQRAAYIDYIDELYNAERLTQILKDVTNIIGAHVLNISRQDYEPHGASVTILIAEHELDEPTPGQIEPGPGPLPETVVAHLDKSHVTVHSYPESHPDNGISTFRLDIDVSTCRDVDGKKLFIDHDITSIQDYLAEDTKQAYQMIDVNVYQENMFHTKMLLKDFELDNYLFGTSRRDITFEEARDIESRLRKEMLEIFYSRNLD